MRLRRRVPFCLDNVEVRDFYELKMVLELQISGAGANNFVPLCPHCLTPFSAISHTVCPAAHET